MCQQTVTLMSESSGFRAPETVPGSACFEWFSRFARCEKRGRERNQFRESERRNYETNPAILLKNKQILFLPGPSMGTLRVGARFSPKFSQVQSPS